jgi:hypothetical protein
MVFFANEVSQRVSFSTLNVETKTENIILIKIIPANEMKRFDIEYKLLLLF